MHVNGVRGLSARALLAAFLVHTQVPSVLAAAQWTKRLTQLGACGIGTMLGKELGEKVADIEARKLNLDTTTAAQHRKAFQIGFALALCGGGAALAGTTYEKLSKRGKEAREKELLSALEDAQPRTYTDPERPSLQGQLTPQTSVVEGDKECRIVEDQLADGENSDQALVKYCRPTSGGAWAVQRL